MLGVGEEGPATSSSALVAGFKLPNKISAAVTPAWASGQGQEAGEGSCVAVGQLFSDIRCISWITCFVLLTRPTN